MSQSMDETAESQDACAPGDASPVEMQYNLMVLRAILRHLEPEEPFISDSESDDESDIESDNESDYEYDLEGDFATGATSIPSRFLGTNYPLSTNKYRRDQVMYQFPILYRESCEKPNCEGYDYEDNECPGAYVVRYGNKTCLSATQTKQLRKVVSESARTVRRDHPSTKWEGSRFSADYLAASEQKCLDSTKRADYPGASDEKTLAGLSLLEQIVESRITRGEPRMRYQAASKSAPPLLPDPELGFKIMKDRATFYWSKWYRLSGSKHTLMPDGNSHQANTARKRHNDEEVLPGSQRQKKRSVASAAADSIAMSTVDGSSRRQSRSGERTEAAEPQHVLEESNKTLEAAWALDMHMPRKMASLEQIRRSPWARDPREAVREFVDSITPNLSANTISRLATLSERHSAQQVVLQINLKQLDEMMGALDGRWSCPIAESGFTISERHVRSFPRICVQKTDVDRLLDYRLDSAIFDRRRTETKLGFRPSGLFTAVQRREPSTGARTLRERFHEDVSVSMLMTGSSQEGTSDMIQISGVAAEVQTSRSQLEDDASDQDQDAHTRCDPNHLEDDGSQTVSPYTTANGLNTRFEAHAASIAPDSNSSRGGKRIEASDRPSDVTKNLCDNSVVKKNLHNAAATPSKHRSTETKGTQDKSQNTSEARGRPKRTVKPSRRATEATSAKSKGSKGDVAPT